MIKINKAILHSFDLTTSELYLSSQELDLEERKTKSFITRHVRKASSAVENNKGVFAQNSNFADELNSYVQGEVSFKDLTQQIATFFYEELRKGDDETPCDLLIADYSDTVLDVDISKEAADAAFEGGQNRFFAILLLPRKEIFIHSIAGFDANVVADVMKTNAALPNPSQKIDTYAVINYTDMTVVFHDKERTIAGAPSYMISDGLLQCTKEASTKEVIQTVTSIVEDVAQEHGMNPAQAISKAKAYVKENVDVAAEFYPEEVGKVVFEDEPEYIEKYEKKAIVKRLPEKVQVKKSQASRMTKNHKIKTDTGIEITFPSEYAKDSEYIEFVQQSDGLVSIQLKNISSIENK